MQRILYQIQAYIGRLVLVSHIVPVLARRGVVACMYF